MPWCADRDPTLRYALDAAAVLGWYFTSAIHTSWPNTAEKGAWATASVQTAESPSPAQIVKLSP